jgi:hypothetical protein
MNVERQLELQAWVDGELPESQARRVADLVALDQSAQAMVAELRLTQSILSGNEPERKLSDSREFYWSKIQRGIELAEKAADRESSEGWLLSWRRLWMPLSGVAVIAFLSVVSLNLFHQKADDSMRYLVEVENLSEEVGSISYKSQSENMFVVYLYNKDQEAESAPDLEPMDDTVIQ